MNHLDRSTRPVDPNYIEKVLYSRSRTMGERMLDGARLFDLDCQLERIRIRAQFPIFSDEQVEQELKYRLAVARWNEDECQVRSAITLWNIVGKALNGLLV